MGAFICPAQAGSVPSPYGSVVRISRSGTPASRSRHTNFPGAAVPAVCSDFLNNIAQLTQTDQPLRSVGAERDRTSKSGAVKKVAGRSSRRSFEALLAQFAYQRTRRTSAFGSFILRICTVGRQNPDAEKICKVYRKERRSQQGGLCYPVVAIRQSS